MKTDENSLLRIYASTTDKMGNELLYEYLVFLAKENGIAGVTVYRGIMGYGLSSRTISTSRFWELTEKLPVVVEMMDTTVKLENFYQSIEEKLKNIHNGCLVTMQPVEVKLHKYGNKK
jgi:PII-like signaling protein